MKLVRRPVYTYGYTVHGIGIGLVAIECVRGRPTFLAKKSGRPIGSS
jgi:hypothetical protein